MRSTLVIAAMLVAFLVFAGCENNDETSPTGNNPHGDMQIHGNVTDATGAELAGVVLHVVYDFEPVSLQRSTSVMDVSAPPERGRASLDSVEMGFAFLQPSYNAVFIYWRTLSEINNDHFQLLRDGAMIASIQGAGTSATAHDYTYTDQTALNDISYTYTLSAVDMNGNVQVVFSDTVTPGIPFVEVGEVSFFPLDNAVRIVWRTYSEFNNDHFQISRDSQMIANIQGAGSSATGLYYMFTDQTAMNSVTYTYELRAVDFNGYEQYLASDTVTPSFWNAIVTEYALHQNFPNPAEDTTVIAFDLVEANALVLKVFDMAGIEIAALADGNYTAGRHGIDFIVSNLANGLYRYRLTVAAYEAEKVLLKNATDYESLRSVPGVATTDSAGHFTFDAHEGNTIVLSDSIARSLGTTVLDRAKIVALKSGYAPADTTVSLAGDTWHSLTFVLEALR